MGSSLGGMTAHGIPYERVRRWSRPLLTDRAIRRDLARFLRSTQKDTCLRAAERLRHFDPPALVAWARRTGGCRPRPADASPNCCRGGDTSRSPGPGRWSPMDNPEALARELRRFIGESG
ncbi:hypothetical protein OH786_01375 [Streptomyces atratus]|uniref:Alpha/beta hydrolase n=1 Tax=Streptomyces atratus TaxID=1893 RepID=A0A1K1YEV1_STRAR|nr:hypothetical protein [Streptomyces atratus]SFX60035.1 hypothetical protein SAMN02787144_1004241 [Streptomyces atratus]